MADSMTAELKRALWNIVKAWDEEYGSDGDYDALLDHLLARLAAGSPEVIEAMARAMYEGGRRPFEQCVDKDHWRNMAGAALVAGMKVMAEGGK